MKNKTDKPNNIQNCAGAEASSACIVSPEKFLININYHPEYNIKPHWMEYTQAEYMALVDIGTMEWVDMLQDGAIKPIEG